MDHAIKRSSRVYKKWVKRGRKENDHDNVREVQKATNKLIREAKQTYYNKLHEKLPSPQTGQKHFWNAFKRITNKSKQTNIPLIAENNNFITNFQKKLIFNDYFADQCKILDNGSTSPEVSS